MATEASSYLPQVDWKTMVRDVIKLTDWTYRVTIKAIDVNDLGAGQIDLANGNHYLVDFLGNIYTITDTNVGGVYNVEITDDFKYSFGPTSGRIARVCMSVGDGDAPYISPIKYKPLDKTALDNRRAVDLDILYKSLGNKKSRHGFESKEDNTLSFLVDTFQIEFIPTVTPPITTFFKVWNKGVLVEKVTESIVVSVVEDVVSNWFVYYNESNTLTVSDEPWGIFIILPICTIYWDGNVGTITDHRHPVLTDYDFLPSQLYSPSGNKVVGYTDDLTLNIEGDIILNTNGNYVLFSTYTGENSDGGNIWIGGGGQDTVGVPGFTWLGSLNTSIGVNALKSNSIGFYNTAVGNDALSLNTDGGLNSAFGLQALRVNTLGNYNTAVGVSALRDNVTGNINSAFGVQALRYNISGEKNSAFGMYAGTYLSDGSTSNTNPNDSVFLGFFSRAEADNQINQIVIGSEAIGNGSNSVTIGNDSIVKTILTGNINIGTKTGLSLLTVKGGGVHIGGDSDAGENNLLVDELITSNTARFLEVGAADGSLLGIDVNGYLTSTPSTVSEILSYTESKIFTNPYSLVTKEYADTIATVGVPKLPVDVATVENITLSGAQVIDGYTVGVGDRVLVKDQNISSENGIYDTDTSDWIRSSDSDTWSELYREYVIVLHGTVNIGRSYVSTIPSSGTLESDDITFEIFNIPSNIVAGAALTKLGTTLNVNVDNSTIEVYSNYLRVIPNLFSPYIHIHDDRYYRETEINNFFSGATAITGYNKENWDVAYTHSQTLHNFLLLTGGTMSNTNLVTNLNSDLLDGHHSNYFATYDHNHSGVYEPYLGIPSTSGYVLSSNTSGLRSWIPMTGGSGNGGAISQSFTNVTSVTVNHNLGIYPLVEVIETDGSTIIPYSIVRTSLDQVVVTFNSSKSGYVLISYGSGIEGTGIPAGGTINQVLAKVNGDDYNVEWVTSSIVGALVDGDFLSDGLMVRVSEGVYGIVTDNSSNWDLAFGWGDHSLVGYLTEFVEEDPLFTASPAFGITAGDIITWNTFVSNVTHTGEVTGTDELTISENTISASKIKGTSSTKLANGSSGNLLKSLGDGTFGWDSSIYLTSFEELDPIHTSWLETERNQNYIFAAPSGALGAPSFRLLTTLDLPAECLVDEDFASQGVMVRGDDSGSYSSIHLASGEVIRRKLDDSGFEGFVPIPGGSIPSGTVTGQLMWWDETSSPKQWKMTDTSKLQWDDTLGKLIIGTTTVATESVTYYLYYGNSGSKLYHVESYRSANARTSIGVPNLTKPDFSGNGGAAGNQLCLGRNGDLVDLVLGDGTNDDNPYVRFPRYTTAGVLKNDTDGVISSVENSVGLKVFWSGTLTAYNAIGTKDSNTIYFIEE